MSIKYVILGFINWQAMTGYDLKKIIAASETLPWSANNNQIYRALVQLHEDKWVTKTIEDQEGAPDRHIYQITEIGQGALKDWVQTPPGPPQSKKEFLHQLMWADCLTGEQIDLLLANYLDEVNNKVFLLRVQADRKLDQPGRSKREVFLWEKIYQNWIQQYETEGSWVRETRRELALRADRW